MVRTKGSLVRAPAGAPFVVALSKSHLPPARYWLNPGSGGRTADLNSDEAGDYAVPNVLSSRDLVSRPDRMDETVPHTGVLNNSIDLLSIVYTFKELIIVHQVVSETNIFPRIEKVF